jgi:hypothetical protein
MLILTPVLEERRRRRQRMSRPMLQLCYYTYRLLSYTCAHLKFYGVILWEYPEIDFFNIYKLILIQLRDSILTDKY